MCQSFKRPGQSLAATSAAGLQPSRLFYVTDRSTGFSFLVDTCAEVSIIPPSRNEKAHRHDNFSLQAVNSTTIMTYGTRSLTLYLGLRRTFRWVFIIADVKKPILGADFLRNFGLLVDVKHNRLSDTRRCWKSKALSLILHRSAHHCTQENLRTNSQPFSPNSPQFHRHDPVNVQWNTMWRTTLRPQVHLSLYALAALHQNDSGLPGMNSNKWWS